MKVSENKIVSKENLPKIIFFGALVLIGYTSVLVTLFEIIKGEDMIGRECNHIPIV